MKDPNTLFEDLGNGIITFKDVLDLSKCQELIAQFDKENVKVNESPVVDEARNVGNYRECSTVFMNRLPKWHPQKDAMIESIKPFVLHYNHIFQITKAFADTGFEFVKYEPGKVCQIHCDGGQSQMSIFGSMVLFLNTIPGGELYFPTQKIKVAAEAGKMVMFPASYAYPHLTTPSTESRYVIVSFFRYTNGKVI